MSEESLFEPTSPTSKNKNKGGLFEDEEDVGTSKNKAPFEDEDDFTQFEKPKPVPKKEIPRTQIKVIEEDDLFSTKPSTTSSSKSKGDFDDELFSLGSSKDSSLGLGDDLDISSYIAKQKGKSSGGGLFD